MATRAEIVAVETAQENEAVFHRLLLAHGKPPSAWSRSMDKWEHDVYDSVRAMLPNSDADMVVWHYQCWLTKEERNVL